MNQSTPREQAGARPLYLAFLSAVVSLHCLNAETTKAIPGAEINQLVMEISSHQGFTKPKVISHIDLTRPFETKTQWTFVAVQEDAQLPTRIEDQGPILVCLVKASSPDCSEEFYEPTDGEQPWSNSPYLLLASRVVYVRQNQSNPLLLVQVCGAQSFNGNCEIVTALYKYDRGADHFIRVFQNATGRNNNQATRFVERGPLQGDVIVDYPTEHAPYTFWIEVYRANKSSSYVQILRYRGRTGYGDGNPLAVADSEMPEILRRLGLWQPGDALPVPDRLPQGCSDLFMRDSEEWCK